MISPFWYLVVLTLCIPSSRGLAKPNLGGGAIVFSLRSSTLENGTFWNILSLEDGCLNVADCFNLSCRAMSRSGADGVALAMFDVGYDCLGAAADQSFVYQRGGSIFALQGLTDGPYAYQTIPKSVRWCAYGWNLCASQACILYASPQTTVVGFQPTSEFCSNS